MDSTTSSNVTSPIQGLEINPALTYEDQESDYAFTAFTSILFFLGVTGNLCSLLTYLRSRRLRTPQNIFVINLALADFLTLFCAPIIIVNSFTDSLRESSGACLAVVIFLRMSTILGVVTIASIGIVRYLCIVHWKSKLARFRWSYCVIGLVVVWLYSSAWTFLPLLSPYSRYAYNPRMYLCLYSPGENSLIIATLMCTYIVSAVLIAYLYLRIFLKVRGSRVRVQGTSPQTRGTTTPQPIYTVQQATRQAHRPTLRLYGRQALILSQETKLAIQLAIIFLVFVVCWAPYTFHTMFDRSLEKPQDVYNFYIICILINAAANPFIYLAYNRLYRRELKKLFCCCWARCRCFKCVQDLVESKCGSWCSRAVEPGASSIQEDMEIIPPGSRSDPGLNQAFE